MNNQFLNDELVNKFHYLSRELIIAKNHISTLENENKYLRDVLINLTSVNKENYNQSFEDSCESTVSV